MVKPSPEKKTQTSISKTQQHFKGVGMRKWGKWVSEVRVPYLKGHGKIWLGSYDTPQQAARAYDCAVYCLRGPQSKFNFPDSLPEIPSASMLSHAQIQAVAAKFGKEEFRQVLDCNATFSGSESQSCIYSQQSLEEPDLGVLDSLLKEVERFESPITEDLGLLDSLFKDVESFESPITEDLGLLDSLFKEVERFEYPVTEDLGLLDSLFKDVESFESPITEDLGLLDSLFKDVESFESPVTEDLGLLDSLFKEVESFESPITEDFLPLDRLLEDTEFLKVVFSRGWTEDSSDFSISNN
ncbi:hypothetical protein SUGI_0127650 [Cryptomeria japonica]|uniref:ethylene-responsive transcription factor ERF042 n=1 Tax=Cryptomeria japonica TaxID=3369 RepID=UPI002408A246|nr:ethylene-responsive transcription factor ERF042 [Cryptomeria japonica]GLJ10408.1 hypothetical protein SUGI_0127650 [Cryptomeria japonica]